METKFKFGYTEEELDEIWKREGGTFLDTSSPALPRMAVIPAQTMRNLLARALPFKEPIAPAPPAEDAQLLILAGIEELKAAYAKREARYKQEAEAWEQLAASFPAIQADAMEPIAAAQFIIRQYEGVSGRDAQHRELYNEERARREKAEADLRERIDQIDRQEAWIKDAKELRGSLRGEIELLKAREADLRTAITGNAAIIENAKRKMEGMRDSLGKFQTKNASLEKQVAMDTIRFEEMAAHGLNLELQIKTLNDDLAAARKFLEHQARGDTPKVHIDNRAGGPLRAFGSFEGDEIVIRITR